jgi:uncharacterized protein (DUF2236 family)
MRYWEEMLAPAGPIEATQAARRMSALIVRPPFPYVPTPFVELAGLPGLALLPERLRDEFGIAWSARRAALARALDVTVRGWTSAVPGALRWMPQANAAYSRVRLAS